MIIEQLNERFGEAGAVEFAPGRGGMTSVILTGKGGRGVVMLHGAHVVEFQAARPAGQKPVLWVSGKSWFAPGKPIRGGVPVCWPWFSGDGPEPAAPGHGFARLVEWRVRSAALLPDGRATLTLALDAGGIDERMRAWWPHEFELIHTATVGGELTMELETRNTGDAPFTITEALHTYFAVSDVRQVRIHGLEGAEYLDTVGAHARRRQEHQPIAFTAETDRDYLGNTATCTLEDPGWGRRIAVHKSRSRSTVVWNPWAAKAARMPDFGDDEWPGMVCIESANIRTDDAVAVRPGEAHVLGATISAYA